MPCLNDITSRQDNESSGAWFSSDFHFDLLKNVDVPGCELGALIFVGIHSPQRVPAGSVILGTVETKLKSRSHGCVSK